MPDARRVAVLIPALNEALRIRGVVEAALEECPNVIVVDDGSDDTTVDCIADLPVVLIRHPRRLGKGAALRTGFAEALRRGLDGVISMDGDGQHDAHDIPRLLAAADRNHGDIIIGARLRKRACQPAYRRLANEFGDWGIAWGCGFRIADSQSGQRYYPAAVCALDNVPGEDFVFEAQILISAARRLGSGVVSVPVESRYGLGPHSGCPGPEFRRSHFRPLRDLYRITSHIVAQVWTRGDVVNEYRRTRDNPPRIDDPDGELAATDLDPAGSSPQ